MALAFALVPTHLFRLRSFGVMEISGKNDARRITLWFPVGTITRHVCLAGSGIWCRALPVTPSPPLLSSNPTTVVAWITPVRTALPERTCRGIDQRTHTSAPLRISLSRVNAEPSIAWYSSTLTMPGPKQLDCRRGRERGGGTSLLRTSPLLFDRRPSGGRAAQATWERAYHR